MNPGLLSDIIAELTAEFKGAVVSKVHQPDDCTLVIKLFSRGRERALLISTRPGVSSLHLTGRKLSNPATPFRFCALLRSRITNARIEDFSVAPGERIARIGLLAKDDEGTHRYALLIELTGKSGNVILLDDEGVVIDALRHFPSATSARGVEPGARLTPLTKAGIIAGEKKEVAIEKTAATWNETADERYGALLEGRTDAAIKSELMRAVKKAARFTQKKCRNLKADFAIAEKDLDKARLGELLTANFSAMKRGLKEVEVTDFYSDPPQKVMVALDSRLEPAENVAKLFKRAKKARTAIKLLGERIPELEAELEYLGGLDYALDAAVDETDLETIKDELVVAGYLKRPAQPARRAKLEQKIARSEKKSEPIQKLKTIDGFDLLLGKSGVGNDMIVKKYARARDLWFHAKGVPGAHVLLKIEGTGKEPSDTAMEEAGRLAARNSALRNETKAEVICAEAKYLKKPHGAKPGMVTVDRYRTLMIKVENG